MTQFDDEIFIFSLNSLFLRQFFTLKLRKKKVIRTPGVGSSTPSNFRLLWSRGVELLQIFNSSGVEEFDSFKFSTPSESRSSTPSNFQLRFRLPTPNSRSSTPNSESGVLSLFILVHYRILKFWEKILDFEQEI